MFSGFGASSPYKNSTSTKKINVITGDPKYNYILGKKLGSGSFGTVYAGVMQPKGNGKDQDKGRPIVSI
ncbi:hypothetical protein O3M35_012213 [Rhynocoris fuscipes]|uniref:Uncharacterized protein n=1 Tax=Rhynocoris fuscipes TaxID=488301 RepID=A0AAW1CRK9_9HEMI